MTLTVTDFFCGAGGSSSGVEMVPGVKVRMASNHWALAIDTHNHNLPHADHDRADVAEVDPHRYPGTDLAWFSPACTFWSGARGEKDSEDEDLTHQQLKMFLLEGDDEDVRDPIAEEAKQRSRALMKDVVRFASHHRYRAVVVENVPRILKWLHLDLWLGEMRSLGYQHKTVTLNSAFAHGLGDPAPQLRDRVYFVFWQSRYRAPNWDKWLRVQSWCPSCGQVVRGVFSPKPGPRRAMAYRAQYVYRCPNTGCRGATVQPYVLPAAAAIDWALPSQRIGDRKDPLAEKTWARIEAGLRRFARPITAEVAGHTFERHPGVRTWPVDRPLTTQHTTASKALACPPMLVPAGGTRRDEAADIRLPMATRTTRENDAIVCPPFLTPLRSGRPRVIGLDEPMATVVANGSNHALVDPMLVPVEGRDGVNARSVGAPMRAQTARHQDALVVPLRNNGVARPAGDYPAPTFAARGQHHALVMRNNTARGDQGQMLTGVDEPIRTLTTTGHQSLVRWDHMLYQYDTGNLRQVLQPLPTQTTVEGDALLGPSIAVEDCTLRMLAVHEIQAGMAFQASFAWLDGTTKRDRVKMLGNAVTPPAARDLMAAVVEAVTGTEIPLIPLGAWPADLSGVAA